MLTLVLLALATSAISLTLTKSHITEHLRSWVKTKSLFWGKFAGCAYCVSHWVAFALVAWVGPEWLAFAFVEYNVVVNFIVLSFSIVAISTIITGLGMRALYIHEREMFDYQDEIAALKNEEN
jgi:hypothetical protein